MPQAKKKIDEFIKALRAVAAGYPEATEGIACEGTVIEKHTFKARTKAFLFIGTADLMVKLSASLTEAAEMAATEPGRYRAGAHGWVSVTFDDEYIPPMRIIERWIDESYRLLAPKGLVAVLDIR